MVVNKTKDWIRIISQKQQTPGIQTTRGHWDSGITVIKWAECQNSPPLRCKKTPIVARMGR